MSKKIITIAHTKGGVGKSTVAWNIATTLAKAGRSVSVLDLDFQKTLFWVDQLRYRDPLNPLPALGVQTIKTADELRAAVASSSAEFIFCDVGGFDSEANRAAISIADVLLCPIRDSIQEVLGFHAFASVLTSIGSPAVWLFVNGAHPKTTDFSELRAVSDAYPAASWLSSVLRFRAAYSRAMAQGRGVTEYPEQRYYDRAAADVKALVEELLEVCGG